jgi:hypothetical protein
MLSELIHKALNWYPSTKLTKKDTTIMKNKIKKIYGWSQSTSDYSDIFYVENKKDIFKVIELAKSENKKISNIGSEKSYGDNFLNNEISISYKEFKKILNYDKEIFSKLEALIIFFKRS